MRKFPKLLAVVLAIAIVICPAMCLTTMAETPVNGYSVEYANDVLTIKVTSDTGFMVSLIKVTINGFTVDEDNVTVATKEGIEFAANPSYEEGVLSLILAAKEAADIDLVTEATVTVPAVPNDEVDNYYIALTNIQAADAGTADAPESFLDFEGVTTETGAVQNIVPTVDGALHECTAVEYVDNGDGTHNGICDCADATPVVENEDHIDDDADNACDLCDAVIEVEIPSLSTVFPVYVEVLPGTFEYRAGIKFTRAGAESLNITNFISEYYGTLNAIGFIQTIDGTDPTIDNALSSFNQEVSASSPFRTQGINLDKYVNYYGMNFDQFSYTYKAVGYVRYTDANGETKYVYTDVITCEPFVDAMTEQAESDALTAKILRAYNDYKSGAFDSIKADVATATNDFLPFSISYNLSNFEVRATIDFKAATADNVTFINYVEENYGPLTGFGFAQSVDGSKPTTDSNLSSLEQAVSATSPMRTRGVTWNKYINYYGMNVNQLSTQYNVTFYAHYTDANGDAQTVILEDLGFKVIDVLRTIEGNEALTNLIEVYDAVS